jgi:hypothetical protein
VVFNDIQRMLSLMAVCVLPVTWWCARRQPAISKGPLRKFFGGCTIGFQP